MPVIAKKPVVETFVLDEIDALFETDGEPTTVTIRQARMVDIELRARATEKQTTVYHEGGAEVKVEGTWNYPYIMRLETWLTLAGCNIVDEEGRPVFTFKEGRDGLPRLAMSEAEFGRVWGQLDPPIARAIHARVLKVNPTWGVVGDLEGE